MTIYLFGLFKQRLTLRQTYDYIVEHWEGWFPQLPSYPAVTYRLNQIGWHFESLIDALCEQLQRRADLLDDGRLTDSVPIILSRQPVTTKVALNLADKAYCATKKLWYHGLKWHLLSTDRLGLPDGSKIRSEKGVWLHGLGRLAAGLYILAFYS